MPLKDAPHIDREALVTYWVRKGYWTDDAQLEPGNPLDRAPMYRVAPVEALRQQLVEVRTELASYAWTVTPAMVQAQIDQLNQQLATVTQERDQWKQGHNDAVRVGLEYQRQLTMPT